MDGQSLYNELDDKVKMLDLALSEFRKRGEVLAKSKRDYQAALSKEILIQRDNGMPVTIISDICRGMPEIADLRFKKDVAEALYKSAGEAIQCTKLTIRIIESQINRDFNS